MRTSIHILSCGALTLLTGCALVPGSTAPIAKDPATPERAQVDRFAPGAGTVFLRESLPDLPGPDEPVNFDEAPFFTRGIGPDGELLEYYTFDVQPTAPSNVYALVREGEVDPVVDQLNIFDAIPGEEGYSDFWHLHLVTVPADYVANTYTSLAELEADGLEMAETDTLFNCPIVPAGSTASLRFGEGSADLLEGWYDGKVVSYFTFHEAPLKVTRDSDRQPRVPLADIFVAFNVNPDEEGGGPASGAKVDPDTGSTRNVASVVPSQDGYSPLWIVNVYDNAGFDSVSDLETAQAAGLIPFDLVYINCPVISVELP